MSISHLSTASARRDLKSRIAASETEFRRGWPAVLACFCVAVFAWGFGFYGQAVFLAELHRTHGWPTSTIGAATTVFYLCGALLMPFIQQTLDRTGARSLLIGGVLLLGLGAAGFSNAAQPWQLFVAGVVMAAGWAASSGPAIATILALWFDRRRGFAISLALNGASASGFTIAPLLVHLSQTIGLQRAVVETVLAGWIILIPIVLYCARPGTAALPSVIMPTRTGPDGRSDTLRSWHFWSVALPFALAIAAQVGFIVHMVAYLLPLLGAAGTGAAVMCSSLAAMVGRLGLGAVIDRLPRRATTAVCFASQACGLGLLLAMPDSAAATYLGIALFGLSVGNVITLPAVIVHAEFSAASFGLIIGLSGAITQFALALAPGAFGMLHDLTGNYDAVLLVCIGLQLVGAGLVLCRRRGGSIAGPGLRRRSRRSA
ncbi:MAG TPA: MFS transporter [Acetobacteraceae bacterium]|nr:MFS transporter [Acetobacteraceae bacterium]